MKNKTLILSTFFLSLVLISVPSAHAKIVFQNEFLIESDKADTFILDSKDNVSGDLYLQFGNTLAETMHFDIANDWFELSDGLTVFGSTLIEHINAGQSFRVNDETNDSSPFLIDENGLVGIQNGAPAAPLDIEAEGQVVVIGKDAARDITLTFDDGTDRNLTWNAPSLRFDLTEDLWVNGSAELNGNLDLNLNQAVEFRAENLGAAPVCNAGANGRIYQNTATGDTLACDGSVYHSLNDTHFHNGVLTKGITTVTRKGVATSGENTTIYLTDNNLATGNPLFSEVYHVSAEVAEVQSASEAPAMAGYSYTAGTGALTIKFLESATVLVGGQGLEAEEAGTPFTVFAIGI